MPAHRSRVSARISSVVRPVSLDPRTRSRFARKRRVRSSDARRTKTPPSVASKTTSVCGCNPKRFRRSRGMVTWPFCVSFISNTFLQMSYFVKANAETTQRKGLRFATRLGHRGTISQDSGQFRHLRDPTPVFLAFNFNFHTSTLSFSLPMSTTSQSIFRADRPLTPTRRLPPSDPSGNLISTTDSTSNTDASPPHPPTALSVIISAIRGSKKLPNARFKPRIPRATRMLFHRTRQPSYP